MDKNSIDFPSNSKRSKEDSQEPPEKNISKVITGKVVQRKKGLGKKFAEMVMKDEGSDMNSVVSYVIQDILLPGAKNIILDLVTGGLEMKFFGTASGRRSRNRDKNYTPYNTISKTSYKSSNDRDERRTITDRNKAMHNFDEIVLDSRGDAEEVLNTLVDLIKDYDMVCVADLYDCVGIPSSFTDNKYGWDDLHGVTVMRVRDGFILNLPKPILLDS